MGKVLAIVGCGGTEAIREQLVSLFGDELEIRCLVAGVPLPDADLYLAGTLSDHRAMRQARSPEAPIVFARRTITEAALGEILALPAGSEAVVLGENEDLARSLSETIVQLSGRHLRLTPRASGRTLAGAGRVVLDPLLGVSSGGAAARRGSSGCRVVGIGPVLLDIETIIDIGVRLGLDYILELQNVRGSYREFAAGNRGLAEILGKTNRVAGTVDILMQVAGTGIICVNVKGFVFSCNEMARALIDGPRDPIGMRAVDFVPGLPVDEVLTTKTPAKGQLNAPGGLELAYTLEPILHSGSLYGVVAAFERCRDLGGGGRLARLDAAGYRARYCFKDIIGESEAMRSCKETARRMARSSSSILLLGESGTGKEMFAQAIHNASSRRERRFVAINCGALPESLLESELFGYEEGAFTGARKGGKPGLFEIAHRGTLFLDEVSEIPACMQLRLLRALEERQVMRLGSDRVLSIDIRVIAATNRDLRDRVRQGLFREDLYYRLNVLPLAIPPLRDRLEDILPLVVEFQRILGCRFELSPQARCRLLAHRWRGNARELRNYVEYAANLGGGCIDLATIPLDGDAASPPIDSREHAPDESDREARSFILGELDRAFAARVRLGRRRLSSHAAEQGLFISEALIRRTLQCLEDEGLVRIFPGKGGTVITERGRRSLAGARLPPEPQSSRP